MVMAKKKVAKKSARKAARHVSKKARPKKKAVRKSAKTKAPKAASRKHSTKKRAAKRATRVGTPIVPVKQAEVVTLPRPSTPPAIQPPPAPPLARAVPTAPGLSAAVSPPLIVPVKPSDGIGVPSVTRPTGLSPGQRVRHRYEHWWGTIVQKLDNPPGIESAPAPIRYIVTVDGGMLRDDIRPEDLTLS
jgi:hypothetical protein